MKMRPRQQPTRWYSRNHEVHWSLSHLEVLELLLSCVSTKHQTVNVWYLYLSVSHVNKAQRTRFNCIISIAVAVEQDWTEMPLCLYNWWGSLFQWERDMSSGGWGRSGYGLSFWVMSCLTAHLCSKCLRTLWLYSSFLPVTLQVFEPIRMLGQMVFPVLVMREHSPAIFCLFGVLGLDWMSLFVWK